MDGKCDHCPIARKSHVSIYYTAGKYVRIFSVDNKQENLIMPPPPLKK